MTEPIDPNKPEVKTEEIPNGGRPWLQITIMEGGALNVQGSINDKILAYGLLEAARDAIAAHLLRLSQIKPNGRHGVLDFVRGKKR